MIKGVGVDMVEIERVRRLIESDSGFAARVFTPREIAYCEGKFSRAQHYAARFTAKEAFFKALGTGFRGGMSWQDVEVENDKLGKPQLRLAAAALRRFRRRRLKRALLSLSHTRGMAVALVVIE
ncbi:MAG TPA: holo-ACP synthase [Candidatus Aminicenantes bacterium]|nr:holo-ACP synthase [Candidatus Aminicenantes bacterium]